VSFTLALWAGAVHNIASVGAHGHLLVSNGVVFPVPSGQLEGPNLLHIKMMALIAA
jgi:hypothetical protein